MPSFDQSQALRFEKSNAVLSTIGVVLSAMIYGSVVSLTLTYFPLLMKTSHTMSRFTRNFLLVYVTVMTMLSTAFMIMTILYVYSYFESINISISESPQTIRLVSFGYGVDFCFVLASWGADGFMLWRCAALYYGVSEFSRWAVITVLLILGLASFGLGVVCIILGTQPYFIWFISVTIILNIVTAVLITSRILYYQWYIRESVGLERDSAYTKVIIICIESSALIVICNAIYLVLAVINLYIINPASQLLVHVYVISPLLIVYRVAMGKAVAVERPSEGGPTSTLRFHPQSSLPPSSNGT